MKSEENQERGVATIKTSCSLGLEDISADYISTIGNAGPKTN